MFLGRPAAQVGADLTEQDQGGVVVNALNRGELHARGAQQRPAGGEVVVVAAAFGVARGGRDGRATPWVGQGLQVRCDLVVTGGNLTVGELLPLDGLGQGKQMLRTPRPL